VRDVAVVGFGQSAAPTEIHRNEVELLMPVIDAALDDANMIRDDMGFVCSGSCDYLIGAPFSFVMALDAFGAWPPIRESHVEADGAWALYEAWVRIQHGDVDTALIYGFGKPSMGDLDEILSLQLDPYYAEPLWPGQLALAGIQARAHLEATGRDESDLAEVAARSQRNARSNAHALRSGDPSVEELLAAPYTSSPLRAHDRAPITDGAAAVILAAEPAVNGREAAWITGIDHRTDPHGLGHRDLACSESTRLAGEVTGAGRGVDVAELHAQFSHEELILADALGLNGNTAVNPSGGALAANVVMAAGLVRIGEAAARVRAGDADRALGHASSGPCLQQNLVCVMEGRG